MRDAGCGPSTPRIPHLASRISTGRRPARDPNGGPARDRGASRRRRADVWRHARQGRAGGPSRRDHRLDPRRDRHARRRHHARRRGRARNPGARRARAAQRRAPRRPPPERRAVAREAHRADPRHAGPRGDSPLPGRAPSRPPIASELGRDACYLAGLAKYGGAGGSAAHRPFRVLYALAYREDPVKPSFVVDISDTFDTKMAAIRCYGSQYDGAKAAGEIHPTGLDLYELIRVQSAHYGSLIRSAYGEPFFCHETLAVDDVLQLGVQSL